MKVHGYELTTEWKNSQCGKTALATRGGKKYFLKRYQTPVAPIDNGTLDAKTFAHNKKLFEDFVDTRKKINTMIRTIAGPGGNIVIPCDEFIDGNQYFEAAEFVEGAVDGDELEGVLASLSVDVKKLLMQTAAGALFSIHRMHIVHSDLKLKNVLLVRNSTGNYVAKLIDFDSSYLVDQKPDEVVGTIDYYSPELGAYANAEDEKEEYTKYLTEKSDIFSLGLIFHFYLCGALPTPASLTEKLQKKKDKGKIIYCWVVLNSGCELQLSPEIKSPKYLSLIRDMLSLDPDDRPSASDVLKRLREAEPVIEEPWPEHSIVLDKDKLSAAGIVGLKKNSSGSIKNYELLDKDGRKQTLTKEELVSKGYTKITAPTGFSDTWPEHNIELDMDRIKSRGFVSSEKKTVAGVNGYMLYRSDSFSKFFKADDLVAMKYAKRKTGSVDVGTTHHAEVVSEFAEPWSDHSIEFDIDKIKSKGFVKVEQKTLSGIHGYNFIRSDGSEQFIRVEMVLIQKMAKKI